MPNYFDEYGRCQPSTKTGKVQPKVRRYFRCNQPEINLETIYQRCEKHLGKLNISFAAFQSKVEGFLNSLELEASVCDVLKGTYIPFILPLHATKDIGQDIETIYLPAVEKAFTENFPDYEFVNHNKTSLIGRIHSQSQTRHPALLGKMGQEDIVGIYFPAMDGYSLAAARDQITQLPEQFSLAGGADTCAAFVACPELLMRLDGYPPLLWFGALESDDANEGFHLEAYGYNLTFNRRAHLGNADEYWANGLVYSF